MSTARYVKPEVFKTSSSKKQKEERYKSGNLPKPDFLVTDYEEKPRPSTMQMLEEMMTDEEDYPITVQRMMKRGFLRKDQKCKKCGKAMSMRRRNKVYEWRCRNKKGDCSSCSIKQGSWFKHSKLPFKAILSFLVMHAKKCSTEHISKQLELTKNAVNEMRKFFYELTDRIQGRYDIIGQNGREVLMEVITIKPTDKQNEEYYVAAGQEVGTHKCFAVLLPDLKPSSFEEAKNDNVDPSAKITMVKTTSEVEENFASLNAVFFDEEKEFKVKNDRLFTNIRDDCPNFIFENDVIQNWLNDQVVRKTEGLKLLELCIEEMRLYTQ